MGATRVLVVDDDETVRSVVRLYLEEDGCEVVAAETGQEALALLSGQPAYDLIVLDVMLPGADGWEILRHVRAGSSVPVIFLTARGSEVDKILGLELGADDYVVKPFSARELVARVHSVLRRRNGDATSPQSLLHFGDVVIDLDARDVRVAGRDKTLTALEFDLLAHLARHPRRAYTREQLLREVWGQTWLGDPSSVTVLVRRLREKIERPGAPRRLVTVYGVWYRLLQVEATPPPAAPRPDPRRVTVVAP